VHDLGEEIYCSLGSHSAEYSDDLGLARIHGAV
jgi:hypothetical protein